ncbi:uncharacterized protein C19orf18 homolog [Pteronotus mesoamericanus]|uniref:uncharacterized protein C19orf18 homolog n=1 Tax=Pteronotus mesoamericanus TaxID=1884717 RepID=UPI0023ED7A87|nr:uncharacterized protein C19orf18 homolog [Pteronotus parnellii mesoamericanus]
MDKVQSSFTFLFLFLIEWPLLVCLPYADDRKDDTPEPTKNSFRAHLMAPDPKTWDAVMISHRPALVQVITIACIALSVALICGTAVFCAIYRLVQAEERQQLALLYQNIKIPLSGDEEENNGEDESSYLLAEKRLANFINSESDGGGHSEARGWGCPKEEQTGGPAEFPEALEAVFNSSHTDGQNPQGAEAQKLDGP